MKLSLILFVLALTAGLFFAATQTIVAPQTAAAASAREELANQMTGLTTALQQQTAQAQALEAERDQLKSELEAVTADARNTALQASGTADQAEAKIASLNDEILESRAEIETQSAQIAELEVSIAEKTETLASSKTEIARLTDEAEQHGTLVSDMTDRIASLEAQIKILTARRASLEAEQQETAAPDMTERVAELETQIDTLTAEAASLESAAGERENLIAELTGAIEEANTVAALSCQEQSDALLARQPITFDPGTTTIADSSIAGLDELAVLVADCIQQGLRLQVEGHINNLGGEASNLLLSNGRAAAVYGFLQDKGIAPGAMRAVGFGASDPIVTGGTDADRSQNKRIHLNWLPL